MSTAATFDVFSLEIVLWFVALKQNISQIHFCGLKQYSAVFIFENKFFPKHETMNQGCNLWSPADVSIGSMKRK